MTNERATFLLATLVAGASLICGCRDEEGGADPTQDRGLPGQGPRLPVAGATGAAGAIGTAGTAGTGAASSMTGGGGGVPEPPPTMRPPAAGEDAGTTEPAPAPSLLRSVAGGVLRGLTGYEDTPATGFALIEREEARATRISLQVTGLTPSTDYPAHLHALPCALSGGGHYKIDPSVEETVADNELWPAFTTDAEGRGQVVLDSDHLARADGMSLVIHDPAADNAKMLCADLRSDGAAEETRTGELAPFAAAETVDQTIAGTMTLALSDSGSVLTFDVRGLSPAERYAAHVHALPCDVMEGGGHYKIDPAIEATEQANELWPALAPDDEGSASGTLESEHVARPDAQSVVIHRMTDDGAPKVACAPLAPAEAARLTTVGEAQLLPAATAMGVSTLTASGELTRNLDGSLVARITVAGLAAGTEYPVHVHDRACAAGDGGGHYKLDPAVEDTLEDNEIWLPLTTAPNGMATRRVTADHRARADAQSMVLHAASGERLGCIDLAP